MAHCRAAGARHRRTKRRPTIAVRPLPTAARAAVLAGACWRLGVLVVDKWSQPLLLNDSLYYSAQARQLADGVWFREIFVDRPGAEHGPLTSTLLSVVSWGDDPTPWQRLGTVLAGIVTVWLLARLALRLAGPAAATAAAWIAAAYPNLWMNDGLVMSESFSVLAVVVLLHVALGPLGDDPPPPRPAGERSRSAVPWRLVLVGVVVGLAMLARSELALVAVGLVVLAFVSPAARWSARVVGAVAVAAGAAVTIAPWVVFNLARFERPVTLTTNDGTTLLGSSCDETFSGPELGGWSLACVVADPDYAMDEEPSVRSARQRSLAIDYLRAHADELPKVVTARLARTLDLYGLDSLVAQDVGEERYRWASWAGIVSWWALAPLALLGVRAVSVRRRMLLALPVVSVVVTSVTFYGAHRIRSSLEPVVVVLAAITVSAGWRRWRLRRGAEAGPGALDGAEGALAAAVVEQAAGEQEDDDHDRGAVEVLEVPGPARVDEVAVPVLPEQDDPADGAGNGGR